MIISKRMSIEAHDLSLDLPIAFYALIYSLASKVIFNSCSLNIVV